MADTMTFSPSELDDIHNDLSSIHITCTGATEQLRLVIGDLLGTCNPGTTYKLTIEELSDWKSY